MNRPQWYVISALIVAVLVAVAVLWGFPGSSVVVYAGILANGGSRYGRAWPLIAGVSFAVDTAVVWVLIWLALRSQRG